MKNFLDLKEDLKGNQELKRQINKELVSTTIEGLISAAAKYGYTIKEEELEKEIMLSALEKAEGSTFILVTQIIVS